MKMMIWVVIKTKMKIALTKEQFLMMSKVLVTMKKCKLKSEIIIM